jgi:hypothetical protein
MKTFFVRLLRRLGLLRGDFFVIQVEHFPIPATLRQGEIYMVVSAGIRKWACLRCPGGCESVISLSLAPDRRPRWKIATDGWGRPTIEPSIHQTRQCQCHFWIKDGRVIWCEGSSNTLHTSRGL